MIILHSSKLIGVDIDNTLALWNGDKYYPNEDCIRTIKRFHARNHTLVAWSAGGASWAAQVIKEFGLEKYFFMAMSKFDWFIDDKTSSEFLPEINRIKLEDMVDKVENDEYCYEQGDR